MKKIVRSFSFTFLLFFFSTVSFSQNISGIWRGYFITEDNEQYKYEVQLNQSKKNSLSGVTYSYLDTRFYGKSVFTGNYVSGTKAALVQEIKTVELKISGGSVPCIMKCRLVYFKSGKEEFLEGAYSSAFERDNGFSKRGTDCGGGMVYLRKVPTSDFYVEPFLRSKKPVTNPPKNEVAKKPAVKKPVVKPLAKGPLVKTTVPKKEVVKKEISKPVKVETQTRKPVEEIVVPNKTAERKNTTPPVIRDRKNELTRTIEVTSSEIEISLYDNGEVDNDTISIYLDGTLILANKRLSTKPIVYKLKMEDENAEHTLVMVAENLGTLPPNTSLMIIQDGGNRYQVSITSTEQKNAMVRFRYSGKK